MTDTATCKGPACEYRGRRGTGLCDSHNRQRLRGKPLTPLRAHDTSGRSVTRNDEGFRWCSGCDRWMDDDSFPNDRRQKCTRCLTLARYGLTQVQYEARLAAQGGGCAVCGAAPNPHLCVDHDHGCCPGVRSCGGCVRGLLCDPCNLLIGLAQDDTARLRSAVTYLS